MQNQQPENEPRKQQWQKTQYANLIRYEPSGKYYARVRIDGKLIRKSLDTDVLTVARLRLSDFTKEYRGAPPKNTTSLTFEDLSIEFLKGSDGDYNLKPRSKDYHHECVEMLKRCCPDIFDQNVTKIAKSKCDDVAKQLADQYGATRFNGIISAFKGILALAVEKGLRYDNPASAIERAQVRQKHLQLPSQEQFEKILVLLEDLSPYGAILVKFLTFSGCRIDEARYVKWGDIQENEIVVKGDPITRTKNSEIRRVPIIEPMRQLLDSIRSNDAEEPILKTDTCRKALAHACDAVGCQRITHHDLRHFFATRCIESGVDIPTVSRWLGHKDGGALAMKTYGHLRNEHSQLMARKVTFHQPAPSVEATPEKPKPATS